jgi:hypothetical protein
MVASVGPYMAHRKLSRVLLPPNSCITGIFSISPMVSNNLRFGTAVLFFNKLPATVGVSSQASTSILRMTPGRSLSISSLFMDTIVLPRKRGKNISNTDTSKVGAANWRNREKLGICRLCAKRAWVAAL